MRDAIAGLIAVVLLLVAASLATTLQASRRRRQRARESERALGRMIVAELPTAEDLVLFSEDHARFYYGERSIDKGLIAAVRVLINGAPIAAYLSRRHARDAAGDQTTEAERAEHPRLASSERWRGAASGGGVPLALDDASPAKQNRAAGTPGAIDETSEGIARDRWDVAIETTAGTTLVECGAIRERVSQELARAVFGAVKLELERRDATEPRRH